MKDVWMWPQNTISSNTVCEEVAVLDDIESFFSQLYAPYKVVYFSRARIALNAISGAMGLSRPQLTFVQPFSSHCVLSAIAHLSTPSTIEPSLTQQQVVYHQWGNKTLANTELFNNPIVEDAVDSLITTNNRDELFPNNAPFCVFSLPKITPLAIGAIVVCQTDAHYQRLVEQRDNMKQHISIDHTLINESALKEAILEANPTLVPKLSISMKQCFEESRKQVLDNLTALSTIHPAAEEFLSSDRLPANVIIAQHKNADSLYQQLPFNVIERQRTYFDYQTLETRKVSLIPAHCQANWN